MLFRLPFGQSQQFSLCGFDLRGKQRAFGKDHIVVEGENRQVNERLDLGGRDGGERDRSAAGSIGPVEQGQHEIVVPGLCAAHPHGD